MSIRTKMVAAAAVSADEDSNLSDATGYIKKVLNDRISSAEFL